MEQIMIIERINKEELCAIIKAAIADKMSFLKKMSQPENLTVEQVSKRTNLSKQTIWAKIRSGVIPAKKLGRKYIINSVELEELLQEVKSLKYRRDV